MSHVEPHPEDPNRVICWDTDEDGVLIPGSAVEASNANGEWDHMLIEPPVRKVED